MHLVWRLTQNCNGVKGQNKFEMVEDGFNNEEYRKNILAAGFVERPMDLGFDGIQPRLTMICFTVEGRREGIVETFNKKERYKVNGEGNRVVCYKGTRRYANLWWVK